MKHMSNDQPYLHNRPTGSEEELSAFANETMSNFFSDYNLDDCHESLWQMMKQCFFVKNWQLSKDQRANLVDFYESLHKMILASSILYNRK
jgi:hypothetical protein